MFLQCLQHTFLISTFYLEVGLAEDCWNSNENGFVFLLLTGAGAPAAISFVTKATTGREREGQGFTVQLSYGRYAAA